LVKTSKRKVPAAIKIFQLFMPRIFSFALGNVWSWEKSKDKDKLIKYARNLDVSGIEITFGSREELYATQLSPRNTA